MTKRLETKITEGQEEEPTRIVQLDKVQSGEAKKALGVRRQEKIREEAPMRKPGTFSSRKRWSKGGGP